MEISNGSICVRGRKGDKNYLLYLDTSQSSSRAVGSLLGKGEVFINERDMGQIDFGKAAWAKGGIDGALALDFMRRWQIGFDFLKREVTFWPSGSMNATEAKGWLLQGLRWPGLKPGTPVGIPLKLVDGCETIEVRASHKAHSCQVFLGSNLTCLFDTPAKQASVKGDNAFTANVTVGGQSLPWLETFNTEYKNPYPNIKIDGLFSLYSFYTCRLVLDVDRSTVYFEKPSIECVVSFMLSEISRMPVSLKDGALIVGGPNILGAPPESVAEVDGGKYDSFNDVPEQTIVSMFTHPSVDSSKWVTNFYESLVDSYVVKLTMPSGQQKGYTVPPAPPPEKS